MTSQARIKAQQLAHMFLEQENPTGWFEVLYIQAEGNDKAIQWADMIPNPNLTDWLDQHAVEGNGRRALVVGCGLGDDAEELARRGFSVVAFDIAPTAIAWCKERFPDSPVEYITSDLFAPPSSWVGKFDFIFEAYTLQVLPPTIRAQAISSLSSLLQINGRLLVVCRGRSEDEDAGKMPWPLTSRDLNLFLDAGLEQIQFEDYLDYEDQLTRRFRVQYQHASV